MDRMGTGILGRDVKVIALRAVHSRVYKTHLTKWNFNPKLFHIKSLVATSPDWLRVDDFNRARALVNKLSLSIESGKFVLVGDKSSRIHTYKSLELFGTDDTSPPNKLLMGKSHFKNYPNLVNSSTYHKDLVSVTVSHPLISPEDNIARVEPNYISRGTSSSDFEDVLHRTFFIKFLLCLEKDQLIHYVPPGSKSLSDLRLLPGTGYEILAREKLLLPEELKKSLLSIEDILGVGRLEDGGDEVQLTAIFNGLVYVDGYASVGDLASTSLAHKKTRFIFEEIHGLET